MVTLIRLFFAIALYSGMTRKSRQCPRSIEATGVSSKLQKRCFRANRTS